MSVLDVVLFSLLAITAALALMLVVLVAMRLRRGKASQALSNAQDDEAWLRDVLAERQSQADGVLADENRRLQERVRFLEAKILELEIRASAPAAR